MSKQYKRTPFGYDGSQITTHHLPDLLPHVMHSVRGLFHQQPAVVLEMWPEIIGQQLAPFTSAWRFEGGTLHVHVKNSSLLSLLNNPIDKLRLIEAMKKKVPGIVLKNINFRIG